MLEELDRLAKQVTLAQDARAIIRVFEMVVAYTEGGSFQEFEIRKL